jgi:hypothetical protein
MTATITYIIRHCHVVWSNYRRCFGLAIGFTDHLYTQQEITSNYSTLINVHTLQITTAHDKSLPACCVFTSRSLATASNSGDSSVSALKSSLNAAPFQLTLFFTHSRTELNRWSHLSSL